MINSLSDDAEDDQEEMICLVKYSQHPMSWMEVKQESSVDDTCRKLIAWFALPLKQEVTDEVLNLFHRYKKNLSVQDGVILYKERVLTPSKQRHRILDT